MKTCTKCFIWQPLESYHRKSRSLDGRTSLCKACYKAHIADPSRREARKAYAKAYTKVYQAIPAIHEKKLAYGKAYRAIPANREKKREWRAIRKYALDIEAYDSIVALPCGLCGTTEKERVVDHDHDSGRVRGALCQRCNISLGYVEKRGADWTARALEWMRAA